ncbi:hypothetical protein E2C01_045428 [Portunus trituberculatus]|uniref:Uncharacterized protein n=1 Tax=Portunus trituberculatus TaxID=210409 RepID=A0A5B7G220_PORTR|nr:hypothetical protein [Portunus trituberculatus]
MPHIRPLPRLSVDQQVHIQDPTSRCWDKVGVVMGYGRTRDIDIRLPRGRVYWRNCHFIRLIPSSPGDSP